jgi:hypothetical protein
MSDPDNSINWAQVRAVRENLVLDLGLRQMKVIRQYSFGKLTQVRRGGKVAVLIKPAAVQPRPLRYDPPPFTAPPSRKAQEAVP